MEISEILAKLNLRQKAELLTGKNFWQTKDLPEFGVKSVFLADGPHGLRKQTASADHIGLNKSLRATCFPTAAAMANSWNAELGERLGKALGEEAAAQGVDVILGPGINIKRNPLCGRNFEYFSEDPYLSGKMGAAYIRGIRSAGRTACVKHFAANSREYRRMTSDSVVDERTLREIYLTAFEIAVKEGAPGAVMTAYNKVNGVYSNENPFLINGILRGEWGFGGVVVSDWGGCNGRAEGVAAGSDLEMPYCRYSADEITAAVESGALSEADVNKSAERILKLAEGAGGEGKPFDENAHHALARECAEESIVLLKNNGALPLGEGTRTAFVGDFAENARYQGAGSSKVNPTRLVSALDAAKDRIIGYEKGFRRGGGRSARLAKRAVKLAKKADVTVFFAGLDELKESEGIDRENIKISENQKKLFRRLRGSCKKLVVVLCCGGAVETEWCESADAVIYQGLSGQAGGEALTGVLWGKAAPSGKLSETFWKDYADCPSANNYPGGIATAEYREAVFVGYRYYASSGTGVGYPFGHGLSYTTFGYSDISADDEGVSFTISNTGTENGAEIAQLYVGMKDSVIFRPQKELKGFVKIFLGAGEKKRVKIPFDDKTFRYFNVKTGKWETEEGAYSLYVGASSADIRLETQIFRRGTTSETPYDRAELPDYFSGETGNVPEEEFAKLLDRPVPAAGYDFYKKNRLKTDENTAVYDLRYAKGLTGRAFSGLVRFMIVFLKAFGLKKASNTVKMGLLYLPVRGLAKFCKLSRRKTEGLILMFNGSFFKGLGRILTKKGKPQTERNAEDSRPAGR